MRKISDNGSPVDGRVESIADGVVVGWAWSPDRPQARVPVVVQVDGAAVAAGVADQLAPGLAEIGVGDGRHAFSITLPADLADGREHRLAVVSDGTRLRLVGEWDATGVVNWGATRFVAEHGGSANSGTRPDDAPEPGAPTSSLAVVGRNGWLFGVGEEEIERLRGGGRLRAAPRSMEGLAQALERTARALHELQVRYVVAVAPTKLAVHRGIAPKRLARTGRRHAVALTRLARDLEHFEVLDLLPALRDATVHGPLYHARDEGMNARGAFFAQRALLKRAGLSVEGLLPLPLERAAFAPSTTRPPSGLEAVPIVKLDRGELMPCTPPPAPDGNGAEEVADAAALQALRMPAGTHLEIAGLPAPRVYQRPEAAGVPRALLLGHPVIHALTPWIAEATSRLVVLSTPAAPLEQIEIELPHVVLHVLEERLLDAEASAHHVVERVPDKPVDAAADATASSPVVEGEEQG